MRRSMSPWQFWSARPCQGARSSRAWSSRPPSRWRYCAMKPGTRPPATTAHTSSNRSSSPRTSNIVASLHAPPLHANCRADTTGLTEFRDPAHIRVGRRELRHVRADCAGPVAVLASNLTLRTHRHPGPMIHRTRRQQQSDVDRGTAPVPGMHSGAAPRWVDWLFITQVVYVVAVTVWMLAGLGGPTITHYVALLSDEPAALIALVIAAATARRSAPGALRTAWNLLAAAL